MPFDNPEETQDETAAPTAFQKSIYPLAGTGVKPLPYLRLSLNGIPPADKTMGLDSGGTTATWQPDTTPKLSLAQRIAALGEYPFSGTFSTQNQSAEGVPKIGMATEFSQTRQLRYCRQSYRSLYVEHHQSLASMTATATENSSATLCLRA